MIGYLQGVKGEVSWEVEELACRELRRMFTYVQRVLRSVGNAGTALRQEY